ncbi:MAG: hypothetical protein AAGG44_11170, partial [Planctomycetota bacterium]
MNSIRSLYCVICFVWLSVALLPAGRSFGQEPLANPFDLLPPSTSQSEETASAKSDGTAENTDLPAKDQRDLKIDEAAENTTAAELTSEEAADQPVNLDELLAEDEEVEDERAE